MKRLKINEDIKPLSEFRIQITSFIKQVHDTKRPLVITQHGKGVAVLMDVKEYEILQEKLELFEDIQTSLNQLETGQGIGHEKAREALLKRISK
jgi:prevent-host-death family protein